MNLIPQKPKCLIDTNILIQLEEANSNGRLKIAFAELHKQASRHSVELLLHPASKVDFSHDGNLDRKTRSLFYFDKYATIEQLPQKSKELLASQFGPINDENDFVDCKLLDALAINSVHFLITEDNGLHVRANRAGLSDKVYLVNEFLEYLKGTYENEGIWHPTVEVVFCYALNLSDPLFDSIKSDYSDFRIWWDRICADQRKAWIVKHDDRLGALLVFKTEESIEPLGLKGKTLKLCTFKVSEELSGMKIGELLLRYAFQFAATNKCSWAYVTVYKKHAFLCRFLEDFGFFPDKNTTTSLGELILYKPFDRPSKLDDTKDPLLFHIRYWPHFVDTENVKKFIVPIIPQFHENLFPELISQQNLPLGTANKNVPGNAFKKVYLSHSKTKRITPGSLIFFYRSRDIKALTTIGIVERLLRTKEQVEALAAVGKRSVYSHMQIQTMLEHPSELLIIQFRLIVHLKEPIPYRALAKDQVFSGPPQSIMQMKEGKYQMLRNLIYYKNGFNLSAQEEGQEL